MAASPSQRLEKLTMKRNHDTKTRVLARAYRRMLVTVFTFMVLFGVSIHILMPHWKTNWGPFLFELGAVAIFVALATRQRLEFVRNGITREECIAYWRSRLFSKIAAAGMVVVIIMKLFQILK